MTSPPAASGGLAGVQEPGYRHGAVLRFGDELRRRSRAVGLGPRGLARRTGLTEETILAIESGARLPASEDDLLRILAASRATPTQAERATQDYRDLCRPVPPTATTSVFISYRRSDQAGFAWRLQERFVARFGSNRVFLDVDSIEPGRDFIRVLDEELDRCAALLVVIGNHWLSPEKDGTSRLHDPEDFVRWEIEQAIDRGIRVIPVLVDNAVQPTKADLPLSLSGFAALQALTLRNDRFPTDCDDLISRIAPLLAGPAAP